jgi:hypothetical protein
VPSRHQEWRLQRESGRYLRATHQIVFPASNFFGKGILLGSRRGKGLPDFQPGTLASRPWSAPTPPNFSISLRFHFTLAILSPHHAALQTRLVGEQRLQKSPLREGHVPSRSANGPKQTQPLQPPTVGRWPQRAIADRDSWIEGGWPCRSVHNPSRTKTLAVIS